MPCAFLPGDVRAGRGVYRVMRSFPQTAIDNGKYFSYNGCVSRDGKELILMKKLLTFTVPVPARV